MTDQAKHKPLSDEEVDRILRRIGPLASPDTQSEESKAMDARIMEGLREEKEEDAKWAKRKAPPYPSGPALRGAMYDPDDLDLSEEELKRILGDNYQYYV